MSLNTAVDLVLYTARFPDHDIRYVQIDSDADHCRGYMIDDIEDYFIGTFIDKDCRKYARQILNTGHIWYTHLSSLETKGARVAMLKKNPCRQFACYGTVMRYFNWVYSHVSHCNKCSPRDNPEHMSKTHLRNIGRYLSADRGDEYDLCPNGRILPSINFAPAKQVVLPLPSPRQQPEEEDDSEEETDEPSDLPEESDEEDEYLGYEPEGLEKEPKRRRASYD